MGTEPNATTDPNDQNNQNPVNPPVQTPAPDPTKVVDDPTNQKVYTDAQYRGLQAVVSKKDQIIQLRDAKIVELEAKVIELTGQLDTGTASATNLSTQLQTLTTENATLKDKVLKLEKKVSHQDIVMKDFSDLAPVASFIPDADTEETFRANAIAFKDGLSKLVVTGVQNAIQGSSAPLSGGQTTGGPSEVDKAYTKAMALAGITGKEKEYQLAYDEYLNLLKNK